MSTEDIPRTADVYLGAALMRARRARDKWATPADRLHNLDLCVQHFEKLAELIEQTGVLPTAWQEAQATDARR